MAVSRVLIVPHDELAPRRGARTVDELETATPLGRALHWIEAQAYAISCHAVTYRSAIEIRSLHDAEHDRCLHTAEIALRSGDVMAALSAVQAAQAADEREDAIAVAGDGLVASMHDVSRRVADWVERTCKALRMRQ